MSNVTEIIAALEQQLACYERLAKLAETQRDYVRDGSTDALLQLLQHRQALIDEHGRLELVIGPARKEWSSFIGSLDGEQRAHAESLLFRARELLADITRSDNDDVMLIQQRKFNVGREIAQTSTNRQVNRAYAATAYGTRGNAGRINVSQ
jgi:hypothetical protein